MDSTDGTKKKKRKTKNENHITATSFLYLTEFSGRTATSRV